MSILLIVESPSKIKTILKYLPDNFSVAATVGHICDLPKKELGIDIDNNFKPSYQVLNDKKKVIQNLKNLSKGKDIYFAGDPDREGEAISYHTARILKIPIDKAKRVTFNEITKKAVTTAIQKENITTIDINLFNAQQARRILDRLIGFLVSPIVQKQTKDRTSSAGRVQSVILKMVCEKEDEIKSFQPECTIEVSYKLYKDSKRNLLDFKLNKTLDSKELLFDLFEKSKEVPYKVIKVKDTTEKRNPPPPFTTSSLQQFAYSKLRFSVKKTMTVAQQLYMSGKITYLRTDSTSLSPVILPKIKQYVSHLFGENYSKVRSWNISKSKNAQEAHEAIRPTNIDFNFSQLKDPDQQKLYKLIWERTVASQMEAAIFDIKTVFTKIGNIPEKEYHLICKNEVIKFEGFLILYDPKIKEKNKVLSLEKNELLNFYKSVANQKYNNFPPRYNEGTLVKKMESMGIGRPSTYSTCVNSILKRNYSEIKNVPGIEKETFNITMDIKYNIKEKSTIQVLGKETRKIVPTEFGINVNNFLGKQFSNIVDYKFTSDMENYLDQIALGDKKWTDIVTVFYQELKPKIISIKIDTKMIKPKKDMDARLLGKHNEKNLYVSKGKYGYMMQHGEIGTSDCKFYSIPKGIDKDTIDLKKGIFLTGFPHKINKIDGKDLLLCIGPYGYYAKHGKKNINLKKMKIEVSHFKIPTIESLC